MKQRTETFLMDDGRSIRHLSQDRAQEENSAPAYCAFLVKQLRKHGGVMTQQQIETAIEKNYGSTFGPDDLRPVRIGRNRVTRPKWKNTLDLAKVLGRKEGLLVTRSKQIDKKKVTYVVLLDPNVTPQEWIEWANDKNKSRNHFKKRCPQCNSYVPLNGKKCVCGHAFPPKSDRIHRLPK